MFNQNDTFNINAALDRWITNSESYDYHEDVDDDHDDVDEVNEE